MVEPPRWSGDDTANLESTQPNPPVPRPLSTPPPGQGHVRPHLPERRDRRGRKRKERGRNDLTAPARGTDEMALAAQRRSRRRTTDRSGSGLYLPAWSVAVMLIVVFGIAGGIIAVVYTLGGKVAPSSEPRVVIITPVPSPTSSESEAPFSLPPEPSDATFAGPLPTFALEGPIPPTVFLSPTPRRIAAGQTVEVINVGAARLNVRRGPGTTNQIVVQVQEGERFLVTDGPRNVDGLTWWQLSDVETGQQVGWAVENDGQQDVLRVVDGTPQATV